MSYSQLTENERYQIYALKKAGHSQKEIATTLGRSPGTISRELRRNSGLRRYRPRQAQRLSDRCRREAHKSIKVNDEVWGWIVEWLQQALSLQQVVAYLRRHKGVSLYHETVCRLIYGDQAEEGELYWHLRILYQPYRKRYGHDAQRGRLRHRVDGDDRPAVVDERSRIGDWEGDTVMGKGCKSALLTLVERKTLYTRIVRLTGKRAELLAQAALEGMRDIADQVKTVTFDNGLEFAEHEQIAFGLDADVNGTELSPGSVLSMGWVFILTGW